MAVAKPTALRQL